MELCEGGIEKMVTADNLEEFISLLLKQRFAEGEQQMKWVQEGVYKIIPKNILNMLAWEEIEVRAAGEKIVDIDVLKGITEYYSCSAEDKVVMMFWEMLSEMSEESKQKYLKFVWGR